MTVLTKSRYRKMQNAAVQDRLSSLPEDTLIHILSFLETDDAVRTSILSKRWERLWVFVPNLSFTYQGIIDEAECTTRFKNFVLGVLRAHDPSANIYKFYLDYKYCPRKDIPTLMTDCLTVLFNRGVRELAISISPKSMCGHIFLSTFACATLVSLDLTFYSGVFLPELVFFPMLKLLRINIIDPNESFVEKLCSGCPVLEDFQLLVEMSNYLLINIVSNTLKRLCLGITSSYDSSEVILDAPALEDVFIKDDFVTSFDISARNLLSIEKASIDLKGNHCDDDGDNVDSKVRSLCLRSDSLLELITPDDGGILCFGKTTFMNLTYLELEIESFEWSFIVLAKMPNLERMKLELQIFDDVDEFPIMPWQTPHLKSIKVWCLDVEEYILQQFLMYVLYNANFLEEMAILWGRWQSKELRESFLKRLEAARTSDECQIKFFR